MATSNITITSAWTQLALDTNTELLATWDTAATVEVATTAASVAPTVTGHRLGREQALSRGVLGSGFVWARLVGGVPASLSVVVSK